MTRRARRYYIPIGCIVPPVLLGLALLAYMVIPLAALQVYGPATPALGRVQYLQYSLKVLWYSDLLSSPLDPYGVERTFTIAAGEGAFQVAARLQQEGFVRDAEAFRAYLVYSGLDVSIQQGEFTLSPALTPIQIAGRLQDATPTQIKFGILPGWRLEEIAASLPTSGLQVSEADFLQAARMAGGQMDFIPSGATLEGFALAKEYDLPRSITTDELVNRILQDFALELKPDIRSAFEQKGLSVYQAVILASIIQREAVVANEQPIIASVFLNRLADGMKLQSDPTIQYALGYQAGRGGWWVNPLSAADLEFVSPYNTYQVQGLPPGPIGSPTLGALYAVAYPAQTSYYYFRAACDGSGRHEFAATYDQHLQNGCP